MMIFEKGLTVAVLNASFLSRSVGSASADCENAITVSPDEYVRTTLRGLCGLRYVRTGAKPIVVFAPKEMEEEIIQMTRCINSQN